MSNINYYVAASGWAQAIGSFLALGVAIWVPIRMDKRVRKQLATERQQRAQIVQASLLPNLFRLRAATADFLAEQSDEPTVFGVSRDQRSFDSDFFGLVPEFVDVLAVAPDSGAIQGDLVKLAVALFKAKESLSDITKLQRDGYHAAWITNKDIFVEAASTIYNLSNNIITKIESMYPAIES